MSTFDALWLCVNPHFKRLDWSLCQQLKQHANVKVWSYHQTPDEPCSLQTALSFLEQYIQQHSAPIHLLGHGLSGTLGLMYARYNPQAVRSLTLLSVGANPSISWHAHYCKMRELLPCSREAILFQMAKMLFGPINNDQTVKLASLLATILDTELAPHSLVHRNGLSSGGVAPPLLICHGEYDAIIDAYAHAKWQPYLKPCDHLWCCPQGRHFFHHNHPQRTSQTIVDFWQRVSSMPSIPLSSTYEQRIITLLYEEMKNSALLPGD